MAERGMCSYGAVTLLTVLLTVFAGLGNADLTLRLVQVVHRHGSRSPVVSYNKTQLCGDVPCGHLNVAGQQMMLNAGAFLRQHYNSDPSDPFFPSENYDVSVVYSRSSDYLRTLQSADGLLYGLFPNRSAAFPAIHTVPKTRDLLLVTANIPYINIFYKLDRKWKRNVCNPMLDKIIDLNTLQDIAKEAHSEGYCAGASRRCACAAALFDIGAAFAADGRIKNYPLLEGNLDKLRSFMRFFFASEFAHNASDKDNVKMGSKGQSIAQEMLGNAELHMLGKPTHKLYHYSAHDTTLSALAGTLGDTTSEAQLPFFAQLYVFELLYDDATKAYSVRMRRGSPGQTPDTGYAFNWDGFKLKCMDEKKNVYDALDNTCPYDHFKRFVEFSKPEDSAGLCYLNDHYKSLMNCPKKKGLLNSYCKAFRDVCPAWSCPTGSTLDSVTLQCVSICGRSAVSAGAAAGIATATFAVGAILAGCVALLLSVWRAERRTAEHQVVCGDFA